MIVTMNQHLHLTTWVPRDVKHRFAVLAEAQGLSTSALLKRIVEGAVPLTSDAIERASEPVTPLPAGGRLSIRLRNDDLLLVRERAKARGLPASTYISLLTRSHLRSLPPIPTQELSALKRAVAELGAVGRLLNQIAKALNQGDQTAGVTKADLQAILRACTGLRDHMKDLINANLKSWAVRYEKADR